jgi:hypothetical protein
MSEADSSLDIDALVQEYVSNKDWEQDKAHVRNTSEAVQTLVRAIVDTGSIDEYAMRTVYNLCQNDNALSPEMKKERIDSGCKRVCDGLWIRTSTHRDHRGTPFLERFRISLYRGSRCPR